MPPTPSCSPWRSSSVPTRGHHVQAASPNSPPRPTKCAVTNTRSVPVSTSAQHNSLMFAGSETTRLWQFQGRRRIRFISVSLWLLLLLISLEINTSKEICDTCTRSQIIKSNIYFTFHHRKFLRKEIILNGLPAN